MFTFNWRSPRIGFGVFLFACVTAISPALGEQRYSLRILGGLDGLPTEPLAINNRGEVAGGSIVQEPSGQFYHPFRTAPNQPIRRTDDLVYPRSLGFEISARGINSTGQVVAIAIQAGGFISGRYRTGPDAPLDLVTDDLGLGGGTSIFVGAGIAINGSGQVAGSGNGVAFRTQPQARINLATDNLGALVPGAATYAYAINDLGQVAGASVVGPGVDIGTQHAYRTGPQRAINPATDDLGTLGGSDSFGYGINAAGRVVGKSNPLTGDGQTFHAFRTSPNSAINPATDDLGTLGGTTSEADGINADGTTVGWSWIVPGDVFHSHAFVAFPGQRMIDLNTLIDPDSGLTLVNATAINDLGQIVGQATDGTGTTIGYVLTPVPESASLGGLLLCGTAICARRRPDGPGRAKK